MKRRALLAAIPAAGAACLAAEPMPRPRAFLTIGGLIGVINDAASRTFEFTESVFLSLPRASITTSTSWTPRCVFVGPLLTTVMQAVGVSQGTLVCRALDDQSVPIPWSDLLRYGVILAHSQDGIRLRKQRWGPLWTIYPRDAHPDTLNGPVAESRFICQVNRIDVKT